MRLRRAAATLLAGLAGVYAVSCADLYLRSRCAYQEGGKYLAWDGDPALKKAYFEARLARRERSLKDQLEASGISAEEFRQRLALARLEEEEQASESSLKYATVWFQSAAELFSPPENRWTDRARRERARAGRLWKRELDAKKISCGDCAEE